MYGSDIRMARQLMGLSQRNLADLLGVTEHTIGQWERKRETSIKRKHELRLEEIRAMFDQRRREIMNPAPKGYQRRTPVEVVSERRERRRLMQDFAEMDAKHEQERLQREAGVIVTPLPATFSPVPAQAPTPPIREMTPEEKAARRKAYDEYYDANPDSVRIYPDD